MTQREEEEFSKRIKKANELGIKIPRELTPKSCVRGVYGFFAVKNMNEEIPFYIGKSNNIFLRMFGKSSHLNDYLRDVRKTEVHCSIEKIFAGWLSHRNKNIKKVEYTGEHFESDANKLALAELKELVECQDKGFCLKQLSEAVKENMNGSNGKQSSQINNF